VGAAGWKGRKDNICVERSILLRFLQKPTPVGLYYYEFQSAKSL
jgi:hypothetical protein